MAPTYDSGWVNRETGETVADPFDHPTPRLDGPTIATVNLLAQLREIPYGHALIESVQQWRTALLEAVEREALNARYWLHPLTTDVCSPDNEDACLAEAHASLDRIAKLRANIHQADHLLAGADDQRYR